jgi:hypothetical protein
VEVFDEVLREVLLVVDHSVERLDELLVGAANDFHEVGEGIGLRRGLALEGADHFLELGELEALEGRSPPGGGDDVLAAAEEEGEGWCGEATRIASLAGPRPARRSKVSGLALVHADMSMKTWTLRIA